MNKRILVTGATGTIGAQVAHRLASQNHLTIRAFVRDAGKAASLKEAGVELVTGSFEETGAVALAVQGVDTVVLITAPNPAAADQASAVISAARTAGVRKIVRISVIGAAADGPTDNVRQHARTDGEILDAGLTYVILRPHFFMQNIFMSLPNLAGDGNMYWGMGDGQLGMIDARDIVDCTVNSVLSDSFDNQIVNLTGPESITFHQAASALHAALGTPVQYIPVPPEAVEQSLRDMGMGEWFASVMRDYSRAYSENWGNITTGDVERLSGHPARPFETFAREVMAPAVASMKK